MAKTYESPQMTQWAAVTAEVLCSSGVSTSSSKGSSFQRSKDRDDAYTTDAGDSGSLW